jgi:hypothetical protein
MRKSLVIFVLLLITGVTFGQTLQKGNLIGVHSITITLKPDVTMDQYLDFFTNQLIPKWEESFPGMELHILRGDRGEDENNVGLLFFFKSAEIRDKYWPNINQASALAQEGYNKFVPTQEELAKLGTYTSVHTDWIVH